MAKRKKIQQADTVALNPPQSIYPTLQQIGSAAWYEQQWRLQWQQLESALESAATGVKEQADALHADTHRSELQKIFADPTAARSYVQGLCSCLQAHPDYGPELIACLEASLEEDQTGENSEAHNNSELWLVPQRLGLYKLNVIGIAAGRNMTACTDVLTTLNTFAGAIFNFFLAGFYPSNVQPSAESLGTIQQRLAEIAKQHYFVSEKYSPNFVLRALMEQITHDFNLLRLIIDQRCRLEGATETLLSDDRLLLADTLGQIALRAATNAALVDSRYQSVIAYHTSRVEIRLLPYHYTALLGMPWSTSVLPNVSSAVGGTQDEDQQSIAAIKELLPSRPALDYLAIPHEIGHVVYRFGQQTLPDGTIRLQQLIRNRLRAQPYRLAKDDWRFAWIEELFADAYGCVVAGPISALGFQIMLADGLPPHYQQESANYPSPVLRPLIQSEILRKVCDQQGNIIYPEAANLLDRRWKIWVTENWPSWLEEKWTGSAQQQDFILDADYQVNNETMSGAVILAALQPVIAVLLQALERVQPQSEAETWTPNWDHAVFQDNEKLTGLYERFCIFAQSAGQQTVFADVMGEGTKSAAAEPIIPNAAIFERLKQMENKRTRKGGIDPLIELLLFAGWSEEGPEGQHER